MPKEFYLHSTLICDWSDKFRFLVHYKRLNFLVGHAMIFEKVNRVISLEQTPWLETNNF